MVSVGLLLQCVRPPPRGQEIELHDRALDVAGVSDRHGDLLEGPPVVTLGTACVVRNHQEEGVGVLIEDEHATVNCDGVHAAETETLQVIPGPVG